MLKKQQDAVVRGWSRMMPTPQHLWVKMPTQEQEAPWYVVASTAASRTYRSLHPSGEIDPQHFTREHE